MTRQWVLNALAVASLLLPVIPGTSTAFAAAPLFKEFSPCPTASITPPVTHCAIVKVNLPAVVSNDHNSLTIALPEGGKLVVDLTEIVQIDSKRFLWKGKVKGSRFSSAVFSVAGPTVVGKFRANGSMYRLRSIKGGQFVFEKLDNKAFRIKERPEDIEGAGSAATCEESKPPTCGTDSPYRIDVLVVYTAAALAKAETLDSLMGWIDIAEDETNESYINSGVSQRVRVIRPWIRAVTYSEISLSEDLQALKDSCDDKMDDVHDWRNDANADVVVLLTHDSLTAGLADTMLNYQIGSNHFQKQAFAVVQMEQFLAPTSTFAHELGHLMGAQHDRESSPGRQGAFSFSHAYVDDSPGAGCDKWQTIMGESSCCDPLPYWSHPAVSLDSCGEFMGIAATENNAETLNRSALTVANFRCASPTPNNVWIKDAWDDTGLEPDPATATLPMWKSPYIWVRNARDTSFVEEHQHENPIAGRTNYIYAKVHNSANAATGGSVSGRIEVLVANASTALSVENFSIAGAPVEIASFDNGSTRIIEVPWTPQQSGHFCLLARWISATDPIPVPATGTVGPYVRNSNNVAWRNVNIVDLANANESGELEFTVRNLANSREQVNLSILPGNRAPSGSFFEVVEVTVKLDKTLFDAWSKSKYKSEGLERNGNAVRVTSPKGAIIEMMEMNPKSEGKGRISFKKRKAAQPIPQGQFVIDVVQSSKGSTVGGVSYEIQTGKR